MLLTLLLIITRKIGNRRASYINKTRFFLRLPYLTYIFPSCSIAVTLHVGLLIETAEVITDLHKR